jgi:hypothetical protein
MSNGSKVPSLSKVAVELGKKGPDKGSLIKTQTREVLFERFQRLGSKTDAVSLT